MAMVNSLANKLKKTVHANPNSTQASSPEETVARKHKLLGIVDKATDEFLKNLENSNVALNSTSDLERLAKLTLLLSGEAETIRGNIGQEESEEVAVKVARIEKLEKVLDMEDDAVKSIYNKLFESMNAENDVD